MAKSIKPHNPASEENQKIIQKALGLLAPKSHNIEMREAYSGGAQDIVLCFESEKEAINTTKFMFDELNIANAQGKQKRIGLRNDGRWEILVSDKQVSDMAIFAKSSSRIQAAADEVEFDVVASAAASISEVSVLKGSEKKFIASSVLGQEADINPISVDGGILFGCDEPTAKLFSNNLADLFCIKGSRGNKYPGPHAGGHYGIILTSDDILKLEELTKFASNLYDIKRLVPDVKLTDISCGAHSLHLNFADSESAKDFAKAAQIKEPENGRKLIILGHSALENITNIIRKRELVPQNDNVESTTNISQTAPELLISKLLNDKVSYITEIRPTMINSGSKWVPDPVKTDVVLVFKNHHDALAASKELKAPPHNIGGQGVDGMKVINSEQDVFTIKLSGDNIKSLSSSIDQSFENPHGASTTSLLVESVKAKQKAVPSTHALHAKSQTKEQHGLG